MLLVHQSMFIRIPLILVLVEDGLRDNVLNYSVKPVKVLILVLVEDGLRGLTVGIGWSYENVCLNPCSCGGWSQRFLTYSLMGPLGGS